MTELLAIERVTAGYGDSVVLEDVSLSMQECDSRALRGRNGVGKTTLRVSLMGLTTLRQGGLRWGGKPCEAPHLPASACRAVCAAGALHFLRSLSRNTTAVARPAPDLARVYGSSGPRSARRISATSFPGEHRWWRSPALMTNPALLLDEPMEGLAPIIVQESWR
jgi:branched-chain amino acid transport system ATP-binding protein